ncbi:unnamed protein product, partial [Sphacelaria rigidula]
MKENVADEDGAGAGVQRRGGATPARSRAAGDGGVKGNARWRRQHANTNSGSGKGKGAANRRRGPAGDASGQVPPHIENSSAASEAMPAGSNKRDDGATTASRVYIDKLFTAEMLFEAGEKSATSDYHKNMDADMFEQWLEKRFLPTFQKKHPEKRVILVLDNAAYHHGMPEGWKSPLQDTKEANADRLRLLGVDAIDAQTDLGIRHFKVPAENAKWAPAPSGPSKEQVALATYQYMKRLVPEQLMTRTELFFKEHDIGYLIFTPPYCPTLQPIELFWAHGK